MISLSMVRQRNGTLDFVDKIEIRKNEMTPLGTTIKKLPRPSIEEVIDEEPMVETDKMPNQSDIRITTLN